MLYFVFKKGFAMTIVSIPAWYITPRPVTDIVENWMEMRLHLKCSRKQQAVEDAEKMLTAVLRVIVAAGLALFCKVTSNLPKGDLKFWAVCSVILIGTRLRPSFFLSIFAFLSWKSLQLSIDSYYLRQRRHSVLYGLGAIAAFCFMQNYKETQQPRERFDLDPKIQQLARRMAQWWVS